MLRASGTSGADAARHRAGAARHAQVRHHAKGATHRCGLGVPRGPWPLGLLPKPKATASRLNPAATACGFRRGHRHASCHRPVAPRIAAASRAAANDCAMGNTALLPAPAGPTRGVLLGGLWWLLLVMLPPFVGARWVAHGQKAIPPCPPLGPYE
jgi:hypothetical protein